MSFLPNQQKVFLKVEQFIEISLLKILQLMIFLISSNFSTHQFSIPDLWIFLVQFLAFLQVNFFLFGFWFSVIPKLL